MAQEGTKFTTTAPDGDKVEVVVTKVIPNTYDISWEGINFTVDVPADMDAKEVNNQIFKHMHAYIRDTFNGEITTEGENIRKSLRKC